MEEEPYLETGAAERNVDADRLRFSNYRYEVRSVIGFRIVICVEDQPALVRIFKALFIVLRNQTI